jgi:hypothetical protein
MSFNYSFFYHAEDTKPKARKHKSFEEFEADIEKRCKRPPFKTRYDKIIEKHPLKSKEFLEEIKREVEAISLTVYRPDSPNRKIDNIDLVTGVCCDLDGVTQGEFERVMTSLIESNVKFCGYSTWSHGWAKDGISIKLILPFEQPLKIDGNAELWRAIWHRINETLFLSMSDKATCDASRLIFLPCVPAIAAKAGEIIRPDSPEFIRSHDSAVPFHAVDFFEEAKQSLAEQEELRRIQLSTRSKVVHLGDKRAEKYLESICEALVNSGDGEKHANLVKAAFAAGGLSDYLSQSEIEGALRSVVESWKSAGRISSMRLALNTIDSGIQKGKMRPIVFEEKHEDRFGDFDDDITRLEEGFDITVAEMPPRPEPIVFESKKEPVAVVEEISSITSLSCWNSLKKLGGFVQCYCEELEKRVDFYQPSYMLSSALALFATIGSRRHCYDGLTTTQYFVVIGGTGTGKNAPQQFAQDCLTEQFDGMIGPADFASWPSTLDRIKRASYSDHGLLFCLDEYGALLKSLFSFGNNLGNTLRTQLLRLATVNTGKARFAMSLSRGGEDLQIDAPSVIIYGSTTDEALKDAIPNQLAARDGFFGRHLWFAGESILPKRQRPTRGKIGKKLLDYLEWHARDFAAWQETLVKIEVELKNKKKGEENEAQIINLYSANQIKATEEAEALLAAFLEDCDNKRRLADQDAIEGVTARLGEQAKRIALALSTAQRGNSAVITVDEVKAAIDIAILSSTVVKKRFASIVPQQDPLERKIYKYQSAIDSLCERFDFSQIDVAKIMKYARFTRKDLDEVVEFLTESGQKEKVPPLIASARKHKK